MDSKDLGFLKLKLLVPTSGDKKSEEKNPEEKRPNAELLRELLDKIIPPSEFTNDGEKNTYVVSDEKASKKRVKEIGKQVQTILDNRSLPEHGYSEERYNMFGSLFDELIRQITVERPELNSILIKIRDHFAQEIYNYEQVYQASIGYGCRKFHMQNMDDRLNELEAESKNLLERQDKAALEVDRIYRENRKTMEEYKKKCVDEYEYRIETEFYKKEIDFIMNYFEQIVEDARKELDEYKDGTETEEEEEEEVEEKSVVDDSAGFSIGEEQLLEEEDESPPRVKHEVIEVKMDKPKEEPIDKDLIYRENEELVFPSEYSDIGSDGSRESFVAVESKPDTKNFVVESKTDIIEALRKVDMESLNREFSYADLETGYIKKALDAYEAEEEQKLKKEALLSQLTVFESGLEEEEFNEKEGTEEGVEEELDKEDIEHISHKKKLTVGSKTYIPSELPPHILREFESIMKTDTKKKVPSFMKHPKFAYSRTIGASVRRKDLLLKINKIKKKPKTETLDAEEEIGSMDYPVIGIEEVISESEFKEGIPFTEYLEQAGEVCEVCDEEKIETDIKTVVEVPEKEEPKDEMSMSGGVSIGKNTNTLSDDTIVPSDTSLEGEESDE